MFSVFARGIIRRATASSPRSRKTRLSVLSLEPREVPASGLGVANDFSAFILHNADLFYSDVEGRLAVGGDAKITGYAVGDHVSNSSGTRDDLIVGGNLDFSNGQVFNGNAVFGGTGTIAQNSGHPNGTFFQKSGEIDFAKAATDLQALSDGYAAMPATGSLVNSFGTIILNGHAGQNVFNVPATTLWTANDLRINAPAGATVIVNITGTEARMQFMGFHLEGGVGKDSVILNFPQATKVTLQGIGIDGNVLAPRAFVDFSNGQINGTLVASSWCGYGQVNFPQQPPPPCPPPPPPPCPPPPPPPPVCPPPPPPPVCPPPPPPPVCPPPPPPPPCPPPPPPPPVCHLPTSQVSGLVYFDKNKDGQAQDSEPRLEGVTVTLTGQDGAGNAVTQTATTDAGGIYDFTALPAGVYTIQVTTPDGYNAGQSSTGAFGGQAQPNVVSQITIPSGQSSGGYNFGEVKCEPPPPPPPPCPPPPPPPPCPPPPPPCPPPPPPPCSPPPPVTPPPPNCGHGDHGHEHHDWGNGGGWNNHESQGHGSEHHWGHWGNG